MIHVNWIFASIIFVWIHFSYQNLEKLEAETFFNGLLCLSRMSRILFLIKRKRKDLNWCTMEHESKLMLFAVLYFENLFTVKYTPMFEERNYNYRPLHFWAAINLIHHNSFLTYLITLKLEIWTLTFQFIYPQYVHEICTSSGVIYLKSYVWFRNEKDQMR